MSQSLYCFVAIVKLIIIIIKIIRGLQTSTATSAIIFEMLANLGLLFLSLVSSVQMSNWLLRWTGQLDSYDYTRKVSGTWSFTVLSPTAASMMTMMKTAATTAKSLILERTYKKETPWWAQHI